VIPATYVLIDDRIKTYFLLIKFERNLFISIFYSGFLYYCYFSLLCATKRSLSAEILPEENIYLSLLLERLSHASDPRKKYPILPAPWKSVPFYCSLDECHPSYSLGVVPISTVPWTSVPPSYSLDVCPSVLFPGRVSLPPSWTMDECPSILFPGRVSLPLIHWTSVPPLYSLDEHPSLLFYGRVSLSLLFPGRDPSLLLTGRVSLLLFHGRVSLSLLFPGRVPLSLLFPGRVSFPLTHRTSAPLSTVPWTSVLPSYSQDECPSLYCSLDECPSLLFTGRVSLPLIHRTSPSECSPPVPWTNVPPSRSMDECLFLPFP
jgi:hypothetical protein